MEAWEARAKSLAKVLELDFAKARKSDIFRYFLYLYSFYGFLKIIVLCQNLAMIKITATSPCEIAM